jgi:tetratricopeptide (TPR) repeat protein
MGDLVAGDARMTLSAELVPVAAGQPRVRVTVEGASDSLSWLIDQLATRLLVRGAGEPEERLEMLGATPMAGLRAYLDARTLLRHNVPIGARQKFEEALAVDSTLDIAAIGVLRTMMETGAIDPEARAARLAWRFRDRLSVKDRAYLETLLGPGYPAARTLAEKRATIDRLTQVDPGNADAWNLYGIVNCDPGTGPFQRPDRCRAAYRRAVALDTTNALTLYNAAGWAADMGDSATARRTLGLYLRVDSLSPNSTMMQWLVATKLGYTAAARRAALSDSMVSTGADWNLGPVWQMLNYYLNEGRGLPDAELVLRRSQAIAATDDQRSTLAGIPIRIAVMRGRADGMPTWFKGEMGDFERVSDALFADADPVAAVPAAAALEREVGSPIEGGCCLRRFMAAQSALAAGRVSTARQAVIDIERYARKHPSAEGGELPMWPLILDAQLAARDRSPLAAALLRRLDSALVVHQVDWEYSPLYGNLIAARLYEARGEHTAALAALRRRDSSYFWPIAVTYHLEEGRIAAAAGDTADAIRAYELYLRIRDDVEPRLRPAVERVRAELAALRRGR